MARRKNNIGLDLDIMARPLDAIDPIMLDGKKYKLLMPPYEDYIHAIGLFDDMEHFDKMTKEERQEHLTNCHQFIRESVDKLPEGREKALNVKQTFSLIGYIVGNFGKAMEDETTSPEQEDGDGVPGKNMA